MSVPNTFINLRVHFLENDAITLFYKCTYYTESIWKYNVQEKFFFNNTVPFSQSQVSCILWWISLKQIYYQMCSSEVCKRLRAVSCAHWILFSRSPRRYLDSQGSPALVTCTSSWLWCWPPCLTSACWRWILSGGSQPSAMTRISVRDAHPSNPGPCQYSIIWKIKKKLLKFYTTQEIFLIVQI